MSKNFHGDTHAEEKKGFFKKVFTRKYTGEFNEPIAIPMRAHKLRIVVRGVFQEVPRRAEGEVKTELTESEDYTYALSLNLNPAFRAWSADKPYDALSGKLKKNRKKP